MSTTNRAEETVGTIGDRIDAIMSADDFEHRIEALRREANRAGDEGMAAICCSALSEGPNQADHRRHCAVVLLDAEDAS